jgi:hypothetical protein
MIFEYEFKYYDEETDLNYECVVCLKNNFDPNYGSDIDGNRGTAANFVEIEDFYVFNIFGDLIVDKEIIKRAEHNYKKDHDEKASIECAESYHEPKEYDEID